MTGGPYRAWPRDRQTIGTASLRAVEPGDIDAIRQWRNEQMDVLRQAAPITPDAQERYFSQNVWPGKEVETPSQILLALEEDGVAIGYGGLVHISWPDRRAEVSFLLSPAIEAEAERRDRLFGDFLRGIQQIAFADLALRRLHTETFAHRTRHIVVLEKAGFIQEGRLRNHVFVDGVAWDALIHGCLAEEWRGDGRV